MVKRRQTLYYLYYQQRCWMQEHRLKSGIVAVIRLRFGYFKRLPHKMLGALCEPKSSGKQIARECIAERDDAIQKGKAGRLHRVTVRLITSEPANLFREQFEAWASDPDSDMGLSLKFELFKYASAMLVTRKSEAAHPHTQLWMRKTKGLCPSLLNTLLKRQQLEDLLECTRFWNWALVMYKQRNLARTISS
jgi:hypothetical protein